MMNKHITILKHTGLHPHQMFIKSIPKMKRRNGTDTLCPPPSMMNFSFGEYFDEWMMNMYYAAIQQNDIRIHQIIVFTFITKSIVRL